VVVNRDRELLLGGILPDDVLIEKFLHFERFGNFVRRPGGSLNLVVFQDGIANGDALVADVRPRIVAGRRDQLADYVLALMAKGTA
jgi:hypothetical protein